MTVCDELNLEVELRYKAIYMVLADSNLVARGPPSYVFYVANSATSNTIVIESHSLF